MIMLNQYENDQWFNFTLKTHMYLSVF